MYWCILRRRVATYMYIETATRRVDMVAHNADTLRRVQSTLCTTICTTYTVCFPPTICTRREIYRNTHAHAAGNIRYVCVCVCVCVTNTETDRFS